jgi:Curlin associated repeat
MKRLTNTAGALALLAGLAAVHVPAPAEADGNVAVMITPSGDAADFISTGLRIYGLTQQYKGSKKKKNLAAVKQKGVNNAAALSQKGAGNYGLVYQKGKGHTATASQGGYNNALGVFQFGKNTNLDVGQYGVGQNGIVLQGGW